MTYNELVKYVADTFRTDYIEDGGFDTFNEMARCYGYDSADIKEECAGIINKIEAVYMDEESGEITLNDGSCEPYKYRSFIAKVRKTLNAELVD